MPLRAQPDSGGRAISPSVSALRTSSAATCPPAPSTALSAQYRHLPSPGMTCRLALSGISSGHSCPSCALSSTLCTAAATSAASLLRPLTPHRTAQVLRLVHRIPASSGVPSPYSTNILYPSPQSDSRIQQSLEIFQNIAKTNFQMTTAISHFSNNHQAALCHFPHVQCSTKDRSHDLP